MNNPGWQPMGNAPIDRPVLVLVDMRHVSLAQRLTRYDGSIGDWELVDSGSYAIDAQLDGLPQMWHELPELPK